MNRESTTGSDARRKNNSKPFRGQQHKGLAGKRYRSNLIVVSLILVQCLDFCREWECTGWEREWCGWEREALDQVSLWRATHTSSTTYSLIIRQHTSSQFSAQTYTRWIPGDLSYWDACSNLLILGFEDIGKLSLQGKNLPISLFKTTDEQRYMLHYWVHQSQQSIQRALNRKSRPMVLKEWR